MLNDGEKGVVLQRDRQSYGIAPHFPCGVITPEALRKIADVADKYHVPMVKITSAQRITLLGIKEEEVDAIWADLGMECGNVVGICVRSVKACPGTTFCKRGQQDSLAMGRLLDEKYHGLELPGKMKMGVSGCPNQCGETNIKDIGVVGTPKGWQLYVGGNGGSSARLGVLLADRLDTDAAVAMIEKVLDFFRTHAKPKERLGKTLERLGLTALAEAVGVPCKSQTQTSPGTP
jgi:NAD(P)H-nitrite reductase large subunit